MDDRENVDSEGLLDDQSANPERSMDMNRNGKNGTVNTRSGGAATDNGQAKNMPVHTVRIGGIKVAVWKNSTQNGPMYNTTMVRSYKTQEGEWAESSSLSRDDLLTAAKALDLAHTFIVEAEAAARAQQQPNESE